MLKGISALTRMENVGPDCVRVVLSALFDNVACQQQQVADRKSIYNILKGFSKNNSEGIYFYYIMSKLNLQSILDICELLQ